MAKKNRFIFLILVTSLLNSCSGAINNTVSNTGSEAQIQEKKKITTDTIQKNLKQYQDDKASGKKLGINSKCIGCWKCTMVDSKHFKVNMATFTPDIISQTDISSEATQHAIDVCPVDAIFIW